MSLKQKRKSVGTCTVCFKKTQNGEGWWGKPGQLGLSEYTLRSAGITQKRAETGTTTEEEAAAVARALYG